MKWVSATHKEYITRVSIADKPKTMTPRIDVATVRLLDRWCQRTTDEISALIALLTADEGPHSAHHYEQRQLLHEAFDRIEAVRRQLWAKCDPLDKPDEWR